MLFHFVEMEEQHGSVSKHLIRNWPGGYKKNFMLNSAECEIFPACKR